MNGEENEAVNELLEADFPDEATGRPALRKAAGLGRSLTAYIVEHPEICLGVALALGAAIGVVVKRR